MTHIHRWQELEITEQVLADVSRCASGLAIIDPDETNMDLGIIIEGYDEDGDPYGPAFHRIEGCECGAYWLYQEGRDYSVVIPPKIK